LIRFVSSKSFPYFLSVKCYARLRLPHALPESLRLSLDSGTMLAFWLRSSVHESLHRRLELLFFRSPSFLQGFSIETCGPPKLPSYPFAYMPCSKTPVVSSVPTLTQPELLPSASSKASAFFPVSQEIIVLTTMINISGLSNTACIHATPGSIHAPCEDARGFTSDLQARL
jgi:hypothetical protein